MFPTTNGGRNTTLAVQPTQGDNSLTTYFRSLSNQLGQTGAGAFNTGVGVFGQGVNYAGTPQTTFGTAGDTLGRASSTLDPAEAYWNAILKGGPEATAAVAPYATMVGQNYANAANTAATNLPRGGYASTVSAQLPFAQARDVNNSLLQLQPQAAQQLNTVAGTRAGIGQAQTGLGGAQTGLVNLLLQAGLGQEGVGSNMLTQALQAVLQKMGINVTESGQNKALAGQLGSSLMGGGASMYNANQYASGCWIAEAIYGVDDPRTHLVRAWLNGPFRQTSHGKVVMDVYLAVGRQVAWVVRRSKMLRNILKPLFDCALKCSLEWVVSLGV